MSATGRVRRLYRRLDARQAATAYLVRWQQGLPKDRATYASLPPDARPEFLRRVRSAKTANVQLGWFLQVLSAQVRELQVRLGHVRDLEVVQFNLELVLAVVEDDELGATGTDASPGPECLSTLPVTCGDGVLVPGMDLAVARAVLVERFEECWGQLALVVGAFQSLEEELGTDITLPQVAELLESVSADLFRFRDMLFPEGEEIDLPMPDEESLQEFLEPLR